MTLCRYSIDLLISFSDVVVNQVGQSRHDGSSIRQSDTSLLKPMHAFDVQSSRELYLLTPAEDMFA